MKPLVVGQAPGPNTDPGQPLSGRCGARLADLCGLELSEFMSRFDRANLIRRFPGKAAKGDAFPMDLARKGAVEMLLFGRLNDRPTVFLGQNVARAFGFPASGIEFFRWNFLDGNPSMRLAFAPHPSGVSRWWNDPANLRAARRFWCDLARTGS